MVWYALTTEGVSIMILLTPKGTILTVQNIKINDTEGKAGLALTKINLNQKKEVTKC